MVPNQPSFKKPDIFVSVVPLVAVVVSVLVVTVLVLVFVLIFVVFVPNVSQKGAKTAQ